MSVNGVKFDDIHSYYGLNLILSQCFISPATPKTNYVEIPGGDGSIDLTEALGDIRYNDRTGKLVFTVLPGCDFEEKKSEVSNLLNGKKFKITLDKDPDWYYIGRCSISDWKCDKTIGQITVDLKLQPFKYAVEETSINIFTITGHEIYIKGLPVVPYVTYDETATTDLIICDANGNDIVRQTLTKGTHQYSSVILNTGHNKVKTVYASRHFTISYQERSL